MRQKALKSSSIRTHLSAIAFYHKIKDLENPTDSFLIKKLLQGYTKKDHPPRTRKPVTRRLLRRIIRSICTYNKNPLESTMFQALFSLMYHAALRVSEVCKSPRSKHTLQFHQVTVVDTGKEHSVSILFTSYKHKSQHCPPLIVNATGDSTCPVKLLGKYLRRRGSMRGPLFRDVTGAPLHRSLIVNELHNHIARLGLSPTEYNTHSFRTGKATDMASDGFSVTQISLAGRWKSTAYTKYIKPDAIQC